MVPGTSLTCAWRAHDGPASRWEPRAVARPVPLCPLWWQTPCSAQRQSRRSADSASSCCIHLPRQAVASSPWRRAGSGEGLAQGWVGAGDPLRGPAHPQLQASRRRPPSSCLAAGLLQSGPAPRVRAPWHRQPACTLGHSGATARGPGAGTRLRPGFTPRRSREPARAPGLFPVYLSALLREQSSMLGFSFPSESRFLLASGKLHWFSNQMRRPESWCWTPVPGRLTRGWDFPPRKDW